MVVRITYYVTATLLLVVGLQFSAWGVVDGFYEILRYVILFLVGVLLLVSFKDPFQGALKEPVIIAHLSGLVIFGVPLFALHGYGYELELSPFRDLLLAFLVLLAGYNSRFDERAIHGLCVLFSVVFALSALSIVFQFSSGFIVHEQYLPVPKNQFAPTYAIASIIACYCGIKSKGLAKVMLLSSGIIVFSSLLVIRGRSAIVALLVVAFIVLFFYVKGIRYRVLSLVTICALFAIFGSMVYDAMFLNYDIKDLNSISTGRSGHYLEAYHFLQDNLILGSLGRSFSSDSVVHNYLVFNIINYGLLLAVPLIFIYLSYVTSVGRAVLRNELRLIDAAPLVMVVVMICSVFEYTYPYAPGSVTLFPFLLFGIYIKTRRDSVVSG